ncbi:DNA-binding transcriptional regulator BolA [Pseudidiomarina piscicola]|uniref:DNA-binding transcriptional regulator BolA n=1 Tax=Pseudidiomarina piscicola TaxID=2614830 RepID=A0A6S6WJE2_9GAMM|nr:BolA/IbaG family iron-sulfur metabolism protein [Pseudidiomarina piscicola]CAB0149495.1 DNA-binding transcriptional regulator BolA [Pseudidiomarina piscicola]VZT38940.1 DNA-binding transcriptional regulator BolA [Pseudomonas aeruginosa]
MLNQPTDSYIEQQLKDNLPLTHLQVINESHMHGTPTDDSHFKIVIASEAFAGKRLLQRHRTINKLLSDALAGPVHALALHTYTPDEWQQLAQAPESPACRGGSKLDN